MSLTASEFFTALTAEVPETTEMISEHLADNDGEMLLHLVMGNLRRLAVECFRTGRTRELERLLSLMERALCEGDEDVENAGAVSCVEDLGWWDPEMQPIIQMLPAGLLAEVEK